MPGESISFSITADDRASGKFREVGRAAADSSVKIDLAAASLKLWDDTAARQGKAATTSISAMRAHAAATKLLADAENVLAGKATTSTKLLADQGRALDDTAKKAENAAGGVSGLAGTGGLAGGGMGALIGAGVALAPVIATVGTGLAGLGVAAYGIYKPIAAAAQATGGLQANMAKLNPEQQAVAQGILQLGKTFSGFQHALEPVVLGDFTKGLKLAGTLLHGVEPVAAATGKALGGFLGQLSATFASGEWQQFFAFMSRTAGPDIQLLGKNFIDLANALPPLVEQLQPVATDLLSITDAAVKLVGAAARANQSLTSTGQHMNFLQHITAGLRTLLFSPGAGLLAALKLLHLTGGAAAKGVTAIVTPAQSAARELQAMATATTDLMTAQQKALTAQTTYGSDLVTAATDAAALEKALDGTRGKIGLTTAAQRASFGAANTYITDLGNTATAAFQSGHGVDASIKAIRAGLPILDSAKTKNQQYWTEVKTLVGWLQKLELIKAIRETVFVSGSGTFTVRPGTKLGLPGGTAGGPFAAGGRVPGSGNSDNYPALLTPGEVVVPKGMVSAGAVDHLRGRLPGFAAGGLVPSYHGNVAGLPPWGRHDLNATVSIIEQATAKATFAAMKAAAAAAARSGGFGGHGVAPSGPVQAYARNLVTAVWGASQWPPFADVVRRESGWNTYATNPTSGAYGIPQALPPGKMASAGADWRTNPYTQLRWMVGYIRSRWGTPANADANEIAHQWYDRGGLLKPGWTLAYNGTGRPEMVVPNRGGAAAHVVIEVRGSDTETSQFLVRLLKRHVRVAGGGSVQAAFATSR